MSDKLVEIPPTDWKELRDVFKKNWPHDHVAYCTVDNFIRWKDLDPHIKNLIFYSLNGSWREDGTYLIVDRYQLFVYTLEESNNKLRKALSLMDMSRGFKISSILARHRPAVADVLEQKKLEKEYDSWTYLYSISKENAKDLEIVLPNKFSLHNLSAEDAGAADAVWPNKHDGSLFFLKRLAAWNPNVGLYNENNELVAWCFRLQAGPLGALQVNEQYYKKGYGSIVVKEMVKRLAAMDMDTFALVGFKNIASQKMFEKLGFEHTDDAYWIKIFPTFEFKWTD